MKKLNPYRRLQQALYSYIYDIIRPTRTLVLWYKRGTLSKSNIVLWERTKAADQLGYEVVVKSSEDGLCFYYQKKRPSELPAELWNAWDD